MAIHTILAMSTTTPIHPSKDHSSNFGSCTNKKDHPSKVHSHIEPTFTNIHPSMVREVEYLIPSMTRTPCWKELWSYGNTLTSKLFYTKIN
jgi:hypothetical protein